jgi:hypothetical protein
MSYYRALVKAKTEEDYDRILRRLLSIDEDQSLVTRFDRGTDRYCFSKVPNTFFGFSSNSSRSEKCNDILKTAVPRESTFC